MIYAFRVHHMTGKFPFLHIDYHFSPESGTSHQPLLEHRGLYMATLPCNIPKSLLVVPKDRYLQTDVVWLGRVGIRTTRTNAADWTA